MITVAELVIEVTPLADADELAPGNEIGNGASWTGAWTGAIDNGSHKPELLIDDATRRYLSATTAAGALTVSTKKLDPLATNYPNATSGDPWVFVAGELEADRGTYPGRSSASSLE